MTGWQSFAAFVSTVLATAVAGSNTDAAEPAVVGRPDTVKVAAVQISGYDKGDTVREGYDPTAALLPYISRAAEDGAQLVVFPEYVLGHIPVPGPETQRVAAAAAASRIYVVVGCWEEKFDKSFTNTALIFGRDGSIVGR